MFMLFSTFPIARVTTTGKFRPMRDIGQQVTISSDFTQLFEQRRQSFQQYAVDDVRASYDLIGAADGGQSLRPG